MVNRKLLRQYELADDEMLQELNAAFDQDVTKKWLPDQEQEFEVNKIITGKVLNVVGEEVWVDVGYKSEGSIPLQEWYDEGLDKVVPPKPGDQIDVLLDAVEDENGAIVLSYRKARRQKEWEDVIAKHKEGDVVSGAVTRKIKGGLLVNIGVNVFLPASQVDIRRPPDTTGGRVANPHEMVHIDQELEVYIISVDKEKEKIALGLKQKTSSPWQGVEEKYPISSRHTGEVVNVMSYGAFVKLEAGIEGLVHISEMSWTKRINHPSEVVSIGDQIEVQVLNINRDKQEISLDMKQVQPNPSNK